MSIITSLFGQNGSVTAPTPRVQQDQSGYAQLYDLLWSLYHSDIYDELPAALSTRFEGIDVQPLRNPTYRTIEFYAKHLWPGTLPYALPIETENDRIIEPIQQLWRWSNWNSKKQVFARQYALLGNPFIKVVSRDDGRRVFFQLPDPATVTDFEVDERDNITYIRLDIPVETDDGDREYHIEVWDSEDGTYRQWRNDQWNTPLEELGSPVDESPLQDFGIDFVPFVYAKFRDIGDVRGVGAATMSLRKIWEADLIATSLHQRQYNYNRPDWVVSADYQAAVAHDLPPDLSELNTAGDVEVGGETIHSLPAGWQLRSLIANIDYNSALSILNNHMREIENDLPELAWYQLRDFNQVSGRAVRMLLSDPIANALEARGNAEHALAKANMMGLTMMRNFGLVGDIGSFDTGDFEHTFEERDIIPLNDQEQAETEYQEALSDSVRIRELGYSKQFIQRRRGLTEEEIAEMAADNESTGDEVGASILRAFNGGNLG